MPNQPSVERTQTGLRMDKTLLKVVKGTAEYLDLSMSDLIEGLVLHGLEGKAAITSPDTLEAITRLREVYGLELTAQHSHQFPGDA